MRPMQNVIVGSILLLCSLPVIGGGMRIASDFKSKPDIPVVLDMTQEDLWTTQVKRIDPARQAFERLPPDIRDMPELLAPESDRRREQPAVEVVQALESTTEFELAERKADEWCANRYKSYMKDDRSYQPFGGGPRRRCIALMEVAESDQVYKDASVDGDHVAWCMNRYQSYRVEDNSYQPFSGPRRRCRSGLQAADRGDQRALLAQQVSN